MTYESIRQRIGRLLGGLPVQKPQEPITRVVAGGTEKSLFVRSNLMFGNLTGEEDPMRKLEDRVKLARVWRQIYLRGGPVSECIDAYALFALTNGWQLQCEEGMEGLKQKVQDWLDLPNVDLDAVMWQGIIDACVCGTAFQEIIPTQGGDVWGIVPRDASSFWIDFDGTGKITGYRQSTWDGTKVTTAKIDEGNNDRILTLTIFPVPGEVYGTSLIGRAYDDIKRDCDIIESIATAIHRHGFPKYQVKCGSAGEFIPKKDLDDVKKEFEDLNTKNEFVTGPDVQIDSIGSTLYNMAEYSNTSLQRLSTALGVPEEIVGLGRGSTEATATVRMRAFYDKVSTIQAIVARTYNRKVIDRITGVPGAVWIEFNDPNPADEAATATWIAALRSAGMDPDAVIDAKTAREKLGLPVDEDTDRTAAVKKPVPAPTQPGSTDEVQGPE